MVPPRNSKDSTPKVRLERALEVSAGSRALAAGADSGVGMRSPIFSTTSSAEHLEVAAEAVVQVGVEPLKGTTSKPVWE